MTSDTERWEAVLNRDPGYDGRFYFGVTTTRIYCRPSCPARRPLRQNVRFYATAVEAEGDGLRACRRCHPLATGADPGVARIHALCEYIRSHCDSGEPLTLAALSAQSGISLWHLQRTFHQVVGVTVRQYAEMSRFDLLKVRLRETDSVTGAIYDAGFSSSSRVYETSDAQLGMTPAGYRSGGRGVEISYAAIETPLGMLMVAATDRGFCFVQFGDSPQQLFEQLQAEFPAAMLQPSCAGRAGQFQSWLDALASHLQGERPQLELPVAIGASAFQQQVWACLRTIPYGEVRSYAQVAKAIGRPLAARAVARACAANPVAVAVPCHRVIHGNGSLGGYRWGEERKRKLLSMEAGTVAGTDR